MKPSINCILFFFLAGANVFAQAFPRLEPDPLAMQYARRNFGNGIYTWAELAEISLWASGDMSGKTVYMEQIRAAAAEITSAPDFPAAEREQAEYILAFIHRKFLRSYSHNQTRIDTLLSNGQYNCVSSAVLYMILCRACGLDVSGAMTKDHAFAVVRLPAGESAKAGSDFVDVETTNPWGFDPGNRREFHDQFGKVTGFVYVPSRNYRDRAPISPVELISLILSNRVSDLESRKRFFEAVPLAVDRAALLGAIGVSNDSNDTPGSPAPFFESPWRDMMNRIFNYGASLLSAGKEEDCLRWAALAAPTYPDSKRWQEFRKAAVNNRVQKLSRAGQFTPAREFLQQQKTALAPEDYATLDSALTDAELSGRIAKIRSSADGDRVLDAIAIARSSGLLDNSRATDLVTLTVQKTASLISAPASGGSSTASAYTGRDWPGAIDYIQTATARFSANRSLEQLLRDYQANYAIDFHNRFAAAWNRKNYAEARSVITEGLALFPGNRQLLADSKILEQ